MMGHLVVRSGAFRRPAVRYATLFSATVLISLIHPIAAEALMDLGPWNYWSRDGRPYDETREVQKSLEYVIAKNPNHPGALHY